jgi:hypothetical protein
MTLFSKMTSSSRPRWDGSRILIEITDGNEQLPYAISRAALEKIGERWCFGAADLLGCFANARGRIERLALEKLRARPDGISGRLSLWADDVDFVPASGSAVAAYREITRQPERPRGSTPQAAVQFHEWGQTRRTDDRLCSKKRAQASDQIRKERQDGQRADARQPRDEEAGASPTPPWTSQSNSRWSPSVPTRATDGHEGIDDE